MAEVAGKPGSLKQFAADNASRIRDGASCCRAIPPDLLAEIEEHVAQGGRSWTLIRDWLRAKGVTSVSKDVIRYHFACGHHERG